MNDGSFFVDPRGESSTAVDTAPRMGYVKRTCFDCHSEWTLGQSDCPKCHSSAFTEEAVPAIPFITRVAERLKPKKPVPHATPAQLAAVRAIGATVTNLLADLRSLDGQLREAVIADVAELQPLQGLLNRALARSGDRGLASVDGLGLSLESFAAYLDIYVKQIGGDTP
jgi:RNA polymerase subunit RPABC4/transcription elongation factor Spt4